MEYMGEGMRFVDRFHKNIFVMKQKIVYKCNHVQFKFVYATPYRYIYNCFLLNSKFVWSGGRGQRRPLNTKNYRTSETLSIHSEFQNLF